MKMNRALIMLAAAMVALTAGVAEALTRSDPAIQAGSLAMELKECYGSAALMAVNALHGKLSREPVSGAGM
ncbi:MAG: hypothetical protein MUC72_07875 [Acidobacteria bacterium]|jgi:hypothetical protein|nr:hypothetical protein [Acidobacteriota bacterium]